MIPLRARVLWIVVRVTLREGVRRRLLLALGAISLLAIALTAWGYAQLPNFSNGPGGRITTTQLQAIASQLLILVMFMFSFIVALGGVFAAAPSVAGEIESGEMLAVLARPVARSTILVGKWLALAIVVVVYTLVAAWLEYAAVLVTTGYGPPHPIEASLYVAAEGLVMLSVALALSTRLATVTSGIVAMLLFGLGWLGGLVGGIGAAFADPVTSGIGTATRLLLPTDGLWRGAIYHLEPGSVILAGSAAGPQFAAFPFFAGGPPSPAYLAWVVAWMIGVVGLAAWSFGRRDL
jgi:ABC-2 type transport system permease protein